MANLRYELDQQDAKLRYVRERFAAVWRSIEHSRHGVVCLDPETYIQRKIEHGSLRAALGKLESELHHKGEAYYNDLMPWMCEIQPPAKVTLKQVWALWRNVVATRAAVAELPKIAAPPIQWTDYAIAADIARCLADMVPTSKRIETRFARDHAEWSYDMALRVFEGREPWRWNKHCEDGWRLRAPKRTLSTGSTKRSMFTRSSYVGA
jgi:hypothetical protein